jgi:hypothetical protein
VRRFLADLRNSADRRSGRKRRLTKRRAQAVHVVRERRVAIRRRGVERRTAIRDRRQPTPDDAFSRGDAEHIREMMMDPGVDAACPQCDGNLLLGPVMPHHGGTARHVHCTHCRRSVLIVSAPGKPLELG